MNEDRRMQGLFHTFYRIHEGVWWCKVVTKVELSKTEIKGLLDPAPKSPVTLHPYFHL